MGVTGRSVVSLLSLTPWLAACSSLASVDCERTACLQAQNFILEDQISATQVVANGVPQRSSELRIPFPHPIAISNAAGFELRVPVLDPLTDALQIRLLTISDIYADHATLVLQVNGPVSHGARLSLSAGSISIAGHPVAPDTVTLMHPDLLTPLRAALWFKPYTPASDDFYRPGQLSSLQADDPAVVTQRLRAFLQTRVAAGQLTEQDVEAVITRLNDGHQGVPSHLQAAVLATSGTLFARVAPIVLDGENRTGKPIALAYRELCCDEFARVYFRINPLREFIVLDPDARYEPFELLALALGHEAIFHQDTELGRREEILANFVQYLAYADLVLADPALASVDTPFASVNRIGLLAVLNSGWFFPGPGLGRAPGVSRVLPGRNLLSVNNFASALDLGYREVADRDTPGNADVDRLLSDLFAEPVTDFSFTREQLGAIDRRLRYLSPEQIFELLRLFRLSLAP